MGKKKEIVVSPKYSFRGYNIMVLLDDHKDGIIAALSFLIFVTLFIRLLIVPEEVGVMRIVAEPAAAAGAVWTMLHGWLYFKKEVKK